MIFDWIFTSYVNIYSGWKNSTNPMQILKARFKSVTCQQIVLN